MNLDWMILISIWLLTLGLLFFIPREKVRVAQVAFLFKQFMTWILGLITVEMGLITYPVREFASVNRTSFSFEFYIFPMICAVFNARFPVHRSWLFRTGYYIKYCTIITTIEVLIEKYTNLIKYIHWTWYYSLISLFFTFFLSRLFCIWFFHDPNANSQTT